MQPENNRLYLASPNGFVPNHRPYTDEVKAALRDLGYVVLDPWEEDYSAFFMDAKLIQEYDKRITYHNALAHIIGQRNHGLIRSAGTVIGILEGTEPDSGTVSEVSYAAGLGKAVHGIRCDFRDAGELPGVPVNAQLLYWIQLNGGKLFRSIADLRANLPSIGVSAEPVK